MPTLRRTITIPQVDNVSLMIRKYLDLPHALVFQCISPSRRRNSQMRLPLRFLPVAKAVINSFSLSATRIPFSSAARGRLNQDWVANLIGNADRFGVVLDQSITTWNDWNAPLLSQDLSLGSCRQAGPSIEGSGQ